MATKIKFDERQIQIRGQVFFHGFITVVVLLLINAVLQDIGVVWASGFHQNILILMLASTVVSTEAILRGAYFGKGESRRMVICVIGFPAIVLWAINFLHIFQGSAVLEDGTLTRDGFSLTLAAFFTMISVSGLIKIIMERREKNE